MILCLLILGALTVIFCLGKREEREYLNEEKKSLKIPVFAASAGLYAARKLRKLFRLPDEERLLERPRERVLAEARIFGIALLVSSIGALIGFVLGLMNLVPQIYKRITRPEFGEVDTCAGEFKAKTGRGQRPSERGRTDVDRVRKGPWGERV